MQKFNTKLDWNLPKVFNKTKQPTQLEQFSGKELADMIFSVSNAKSWAPDLHKGIEDSSWVKSIEYDESKKELAVTFRDGFTAHYPDISKELAQDFIEDESKGRFVWKHLYHHKYY